MNMNDFNKAFKNAKFSMGIGPLILGGLGLLALKSYYYGNSLVIKLMWDTMPSSLINSPAPSPLMSTEKGSTSKSHSLKNPSSITYKLDRTKYLPKLPIEICKASNFQSESFSIHRLTIYM